jgi:hypothetical protein
MDLQAALYARLTADAAIAAAIAGRVFWNVVPQATALPYVRMQTVTDLRPEHLTGYDAARVTRVQVDVFAEVYATARDIAAKIIAEMALPATVSGVRFGRGKAEGPRDLGEETTGGFVHRLSLDLLIEHDSDQE